METRQAACRVSEDLRPENTVLLCLPALIRGVQEGFDIARRCPGVVPEGCKARAAHALSTQGGSPPATVFVPDSVKGKGLKISREARRQPSGPDLSVVERVAKAVSWSRSTGCAQGKG